MITHEPACCAHEKLHILNACDPLCKVGSRVLNARGLLKPRTHLCPRQRSAFLSIQEAAVDKQVFPVIHSHGGVALWTHERVRIEEIDEDGMKLNKNILQTHFYELVHPLQLQSTPVLLEARILGAVPRGRGWSAVHLGIGITRNGNVPLEVLPVHGSSWSEGVGCQLAWHLRSVLQDENVVAHTRWPLSSRDPIEIVVSSSSFHWFRLHADLETAAVLSLGKDRLPLRRHNVFATNVLGNFLALCTASLPIELAVHQVGLWTVCLVDPLLAFLIVQPLLRNMCTLAELDDNLLAVLKDVLDH
mmetsp:Transcript_61421/g.163428  ORF Transcript_61421/g.163428 Transcript_61421/m.163428 type:complete len:303 (-) Transcript_61421:250-1158(-)